MPPETPYGRETELEELDSFLSRLTGRLSALAICGPAGIGKTTLWQEGVRRGQALGYRLLVARPAEAEQALAFAGLADLLRTFPTESFANLVPVQRHALDVALVRQEAVPSLFDRRAIAAALIALLEQAGAAQPLLVAVDDAQWLDQATTESLAFAMRRLEGSPIGVVVSVRVDRSRPPTVDDAVAARRKDVLLGPLSPAALQAMIHETLEGRVPRSLAARVARSCGGNPFHALEICHELERVGFPHPDEPLPVPEEFDVLLRSRMDRVPESTRRALLEAAYLSQPSIGLVDEKAIAAAEEAGIVVVDPEGRIRFVHPLLQAAVTSSASNTARRAAHRKLAALVTDQEERARHLAFGASGPDEAVAAELAIAAEHAFGRGGVSAAIELGRRALELTPLGEPDVRARRTLAWASMALDGGGDLVEAESILQDLIKDATEVDLRAELRLCLGALLRGRGRPREGYSVLLEALEDAKELDLQARIHLQAMWMSEWDQAAGLEHSSAMLALLDEQSDPAGFANAILMNAFFRLLAGLGADDGAIQRGLSSEARAGAAYRNPVPVIWPIFKDNFAAAVDLHTRHLRWAGEVGRPAVEMSMMHFLTALELWRGHWAQARAWHERLRALVEQASESFSWGDEMLLITGGLVDAYAGNLEAAREAGEKALGMVNKGWQSEQIPARELLGFVALSAGDIPGAEEHLGVADRILEELGQREPARTRFQPDLVEALVSLGALDRAEDLVSRLEGRARALPRPWTLAMSARCRGILLAARGDLEAAAACLADSLVQHKALDMPFEHARTLLLYGQLLRRRKERRRARAALEEALAIFTDLGAAVFERRASEELSRIPVRRAASGLSPTEEKIARLAASGLTTKQIAERVFLSPKTVEGNLGRIYLKLGISSRAQLGLAMAARISGE